ncbi:MAG: aminotransferase class V-fold PLP-dependent enzyme [Gemmatimonadota bacterium]
MPTRRRFLQAAGLVAAAAPGLALDHLAPATPLGPQTPPQGQGDPEDEGFWTEVRNRFPISRERGTYLNTGTLGPTPYPVLQATVDHLRATAGQFRPGEYSLEALKEVAAAFIGSAPHEIVITRNATEAMNFVANGLELDRGDEILTSDHEHIGGLCCWQLVEKRRGLTLTVVPLPVPPRDPGEIVDAFRRAIGPRTRVLSLSHVTFTTGLRTPVKELAHLCRERGIVFVVDGAHPVGMFPVDVRAIGADFYATSTHKWLCAPQGTGLLHVREDWLDRLWPTIASGGWDDPSLRSDRFNPLGTVNDSLRAGLQAAFEFQAALGPERVSRRVLHLSQRLHDALAELPGISMKTTRDPRMASGMESFTLESVPALDLQKMLWERGPIRTRVIGEYDCGFMRLSTHIFNTTDEIDRVVAMIRDVARGR